MFVGLHWIVFVVFGAALNAAVNVGFKYISSRPEPYFLGALVYFVMGLTMLCFAIVHKQVGLQALALPKTGFVVVATGVSLATAIYSFLIALDRGPFGLVNGSWLGGMIALSVLLGVVLYKDHLTVQSALGVALTLAGVFFMAKG